MRSSRRICEVTGRAVVRAVLGLLVCPALLAQEVYKSVDAQGHVVYSDRGSTKTAPKSQVHVDEPDPAEVARLAKEQPCLPRDLEVVLHPCITPYGRACAGHSP